MYSYSVKLYRKHFVMLQVLFATDADIFCNLDAEKYDKIKGFLIKKYTANQSFFNRKIQQVKRFLIEEYAKSNHFFNRKIRQIQRFLIETNRKQVLDTRIHIILAYIYM